MRRNLATSLKRRSRAHPMARYDRLPRELRAWLADAALPWSPSSALKLWTRLLREHAGDAEAVCNHLDRVQARLLLKDAQKVWGAAYPHRPAG